MQLWSQACVTDNRYPDANFLKLWDFVAQGGSEGILIWLVAEYIMDAPLVKINHAAGL